MTIQIAAPFKYGKSKAELQFTLNATPALVNFKDPTPFGTRGFTGDTIRPGESFICVLDPDTRRRFAQVKRLPNGLYRVE